MSEWVNIQEARAGTGNTHIYLHPYGSSAYRVSLCGIETHTHRLNTWTTHRAKRCEKCVAVAGALSANGVNLGRH